MIELIDVRGSDDSAAAELARRVREPGDLLSTQPRSAIVDIAVSAGD